MTQILILMANNDARKSFFGDSAIISKLESIGHVKWNPSEKELQGDELASLLRGIDIVFTGWGCPRFDAELLSHADNLKMLAHVGGTVAPYVTPELYDRGITVVSGNEFFAESVAEGTVAYMLMGLRRMKFYSNELDKGAWGNTLGTDGLLDRTIGLVGFGAIAQKLPAMLKPFRCAVKVFDPFKPQELFDNAGVTRVHSIDEIFKTCKVVSLHLPRTESTYHIINEELLSLMNPGSVLVNTARGSIVDEAALARVLAKGDVRAVLDVYEQEPLPPNSPLRGLPNVTLMPHLAGPTTDRRLHITSNVTDDVIRFLAGEKLKYEIPREYGLSMTDDAKKLGKG